MELRVNDYLTWQRACVDNVLPPVPNSSILPDWWRELPGNLNRVVGCPVQNHELMEDYRMRSAKFCMGLRGIRHVGYTIPLEYDIDGTIWPKQATTDDHWKNFYTAVKDPSWPDCDQEKDFSSLPKSVQQECIEMHGYNPKHATESVPIYKQRPWIQKVYLHPEVVHGTCWAEQDQQGRYLWNIMVLAWPWRACMPRGWRLLITAHPFEWSRDWHSFAGCVDSNYRVVGNNINAFWDFDYPVDPDYSYYNLEMVVAVRADQPVIPAGKLLFNAVPVYDPDYQPPTYREPPDYMK